MSGLGGSRGENSEQVFPETLTGVVRLAAGGGDSPHREDAVRVLCETYHQPLLAFTRKMGCPEDEAMDLVHDFLAGLLKKGGIGNYQHRKNVKFRSFLIHCFKRHMWKEWSRRQRRSTIPLDALLLNDESLEAHPEGSRFHDAEHAYELKCIAVLFDRVMKRLSYYYESQGEKSAFDLLSPHLMRQTTRSCEETAAELGLSASATRKRIHDMKSRWISLLRDELSEEYPTETRFREAVQEMQQILARG